MKRAVPAYYCVLWYCTKKIVYTEGTVFMTQAVDNGTVFMKPLVLYMYMF